MKHIECRGDPLMIREEIKGNRSLNPGQKRVHNSTTSLGSFSLNVLETLLSFIRVHVSFWQVRLLRSAFWENHWRPISSLCYNASVVTSCPFSSLYVDNSDLRQQSFSYLAFPGFCPLFTYLFLDCTSYVKVVSALHLLLYLFQGKPFHDGWYVENMVKIGMFQKTEVTDASYIWCRHTFGARLFQ